MILRDIINVPKIGEEPDMVAAWESAGALGISRDDMVACEQHPAWHGEGDVAVHTEMALAALVQDPAWQGLEEDSRGEVYAAVLLHDVGKPSVTTLQEGIWRAPGHAGRGEKMVRGALWRAGIDFFVRERICSMIRYHLHPFHLLEKDDPRYNVLLIGESVPGAWLAMVARADATGRICEDQGETLAGVALFAEMCEEFGCDKGAYPFGSGRSRYEYFRQLNRMRDPAYTAYDEQRQRLTLMVGLPGAGKSRWAKDQEELVISLDAMGAQASGRGKVQWRNGLRNAKGWTVEELRDGRNVTIDATNLTREGRRAWRDLAGRYDTDVRTVVVEASVGEITQRLRAREDRQKWNMLLTKMCERWETPSTDECTERVLVGV
jgi:predicted kinase